MTVGSVIITDTGACDCRVTATGLGSNEALIISAHPWQCWWLSTHWYHLPSFLRQGLNPGAAALSNLLLQSSPFISTLPPPCVVCEITPSVKTNLHFQLAAVLALWEATVGEYHHSHAQNPPYSLYNLFEDMDLAANHTGWWCTVEIAGSGTRRIDSGGCLWIVDSCVNTITL